MAHFYPALHVEGTFLAPCSSSILADETSNVHLPRGRGSFQLWGSSGSSPCRAQGPGAPLILHAGASALWGSVRATVPSRSGLAGLRSQPVWEEEGGSDRESARLLLPFLPREGTGTASFLLPCVG